MPLRAVHLSPVRCCLTQGHRSPVRCLLGQTSFVLPRVYIPKTRWCLSSLAARYATRSASDARDHGPHEDVRSKAVTPEDEWPSDNVGTHDVERLDELCGDSASYEEPAPDHSTTLMQADEDDLDEHFLVMPKVHRSDTTSIIARPALNAAQKEDHVEDTVSEVSWTPSGMDLNYTAEGDAVEKPEFQESEDTLTGIDASEHVLTSHDDDHSGTANASRVIPITRGHRWTQQHPSPTAFLLYALEQTGHLHALPVGDTRRVDPTAATDTSSSLQAVLARFILANPLSNETTAFQLTLIDQETLLLSGHDVELLEANDWTIGDLNHWAALLTSRDLHTPATLLFGSRLNLDRRPPIFLLLFVLRRRSIDAQTLQVLLGYSWTFLQHRQDISQPVDTTTVMILFVRLLRHARKVWPEAIVNIARLIPTYVRRDTSATATTGKLGQLQQSRISVVYNRALYLLGEPTSQQPFKSSVYQENAQFDVLHEMASHQPPIRMDRIGYQAISRVLLSRPKTERERDWTSLQALSWPPWKRARTGVDETKDMEYGRSRAAFAIRRMMQSGHALGLWGTVATLYAGREVDGSPVVQTRTLLHRRQIGMPDARVWEARIKTTRTIREAWACFLSYQHSKAPPSQPVYTAMIVKLLLSHKLVSRTSATGEKGRYLLSKAPESTPPVDITANRILPGDAPEPFPEPAYAGHWTYIPTEPPSPMELFKEMLGEGEQPSEWMMAQLLRHARNAEDGFAFLDAAGAPYSEWVSLLASGDRFDAQALHAVPEALFDGFILLLCRVPRSALRLRRTKPVEDYSGQPWVLRRQSASLHAFRLMSVRQTMKRQLWARLLHSLSDAQAIITFGGRAESIERNAILKLQMMRRVLATMKRFDIEPDMSCLMAVATGVENAAIASHRVTRPTEFEDTTAEWSVAVDQLSDMHDGDIAFRPWRGEIKAEAAQIEMKASRFLRTLFQSIVSGGATGEVAASRPLPNADLPLMPRLLAVPSAAELHAYVRALGILGDHEGIYSLAQWLAEHHESFHHQNQEELGGKRRLNTLLSSIRVFLECPHQDSRLVEAGVWMQNRPNRASAELIALVRKRVESVEGWKWPTKAMMLAYTRGGRTQDVVSKKVKPDLSRWL